MAGIFATAYNTLCGIYYMFFNIVLQEISANILDTKSFLYDFHLKMEFSLLNKSLNINNLLLMCPLC